MEKTWVALDVKNKIVRSSLDSDGMKFEIELKSYKRVRDQIKQKEKKCLARYCMKKTIVLRRHVWFPDTNTC